MAHFWCFETLQHWDDIEKLLKWTETWRKLTVQTFQLFINGLQCFKTPEMGPVPSPISGFNGKKTGFAIW